MSVLCVEVDATVTPLLKDEEGKYLDRYILFLKREATTLDSRVTGIEVSRFGSDEGKGEIVITISIGAPSGEAMQFWDKLGAHIEKWLESKPEPMRSVLRDQFAIDVRWQSDLL